MTVEFKLPELGENIQSGDVISVLVSEGDTIKVDDPVLEIETDKATIEVPSTVSGQVKAIHIKAGDTIEVGQLILTAEDGKGEATAPAQSEAGPAAAAPAGPEAKARPVSTGVTEPSEPQVAAPAAARAEEAAVVELRPPDLGENIPTPSPRHGPGLLIPAAPNVRRTAREIGVDLTQVTGTGPAGRISTDDIKRYARETLTHLRADGGAARRMVELPDFSRWGEVEVQPMSNIRKATAEHMELAWSTIPHVTQFDKADIGELETLRKRFADKVEAAGGKLTLTAILLKVAVAALKQFPQFNASLNMQTREVIYKRYYHIGVAVDTERGLLVPVIRDVDRKNIQELAIELGQVAEKARDRKLKPEEMQGGTFTVTNLGGIGGTNFAPIVNTPEVAILGVARSGIEPVYKDGQFEPRMMLPLAVSYDHRLIDGADGARFLRWIVRALESPFMLALQGW